MTDRIAGLSDSTKKLIQQQEELVKRHPDREVYEVPEDGDYDHRAVKESLLQAIVCTRLTVEEAAEWLTTVRPPGTSNNRWYPAKDHPEPDVPCQIRPDTHHHVVVEC